MKFEGCDNFAWDGYKYENFKSILLQYENLNYIQKF